MMAKPGDENSEEDRGCDDADDTSEDKRHSPDQEGLKDLVNEVSLGGRKPIDSEDVETIPDWAEEVRYPDVHAGESDLATEDNHWVRGPHINLPGVGSGHTPVGPGVKPR